MHMFRLMLYFQDHYHQSSIYFLKKIFQLILLQFLSNFFEKLDKFLLKPFNT
jgi:hypothetical protein